MLNFIARCWVGKCWKLRLHLGIDSESWHCKNGLKLLVTASQTMNGPNMLAWIIFSDDGFAVSLHDLKLIYDIRQKINDLNEVCFAVPPLLSCSASHCINNNCTGGIDRKYRGLWDQNTGCSNCPKITTHQTPHFAHWMGFGRQNVLYLLWGQPPV